MHQLRPSAERGHITLDWLDSHHSFSFGQYHDPRYMGFHALRVINQDIIAPGGGIATHSHQDMEIITYVLRGELAHKDSLGTIATIRAGEVQRMSAGRGISHSEYNASSTEPVELLQIWIQPEQNDIVPGYEQKDIGTTNHDGALQAIVRKGGGSGALDIHQDATLFRGLLKAGTAVNHALENNRAVWVQMIAGYASVSGEALSAGDAIGFVNTEALAFFAHGDAEFLLFDLSG